MIQEHMDNQFAENAAQKSVQFLIYFSKFLMTMIIREKRSGNSTCFENCIIGIIVDQVCYVDEYDPQKAA